jgi:hypothetical protein
MLIRGKLITTGNRTQQYNGIRVTGARLNSSLTDYSDREISFEWVLATILYVHGDK